jgi:pentatricopeptide repeat protein
MQDDYGVIPNAIVYSIAISACARSTPTQSGKALDLLREAVEEKQLKMSVVGFNAAISACAQAGDWENAISILSRMEEAASSSLVSSDQPQNASFTVPKPDSVTYGTVLSACEHGEQWGLVLKHGRSMRERGLPLDGLSITSCLHACQQLSMAEEALYYLDTMKSIKITQPQTGKLKRFGARTPLSGPDDVAYRLAISACARGGEWKEGIRLLKEFEQVTGTPPDVVAYTSAITGCEYAGMWRESFLLLDKMRKQGVEPNEVTMAAVLGACATACAKVDSKELSMMSEPQEKALELLEILKKNPNVVSPNIQVYNSAIRACAESGDLKQALKLFQEIEDEKIERTEVTYGSLMTACERVGCVESASKVFRKMREDGIEPNEIIYGAAISCCRKAKQPERAFLLLKKMMKEELSPNAATFNTVIVAQAEGRSRADSERAILVYKLMRSKHTDENGRPNRQTYNILINFFASIWQPLTADIFLKQMSGAGFKPDVDLFTATVAAYERTGQPLKALQLMESMQADGYDFYGVGVLDAAFKNAVKLVNKVGKKLSSNAESKEEKQSLKLISMEESDEVEESDEDLV